MFEAIRAYHNKNFTPALAVLDSADTTKIQFVRRGSFDDEDELYCGKDCETTGPMFELKGELSEVGMACP